MRTINLDYILENLPEEADERVRSYGVRRYNKGFNACREAVLEVLNSATVIEMSVDNESFEPDPDVNEEDDNANER